MHTLNYVIAENYRKFDHEQWRRSRPPNQRQLDNLRRNGASNCQPNLLDWFRKLVMYLMLFIMKCHLAPHIGFNSSLQHCSALRMQAYIKKYVIYHVVVASRSSHMMFTKLMGIDFGLKSMKNPKGI